MKDGLSYVGSIASIIGFFLTVYVFFVAQSVKKFYNKHQRVPRLANDIKEYRAKLGLMLKDDSLNDNSLTEGLATCASNLRSLAPKVPWKYRSTVRDTIKTIKNRPATNVRGTVEEIHTSLESIEADVRNWIADEAMEGVS